MSAMLGDGDAYGMVRFEPLGELMAPMMMGPLGMAEPMIEEVFGGIRGLGLSFSVASGGDASGMAEIHCAVYSTGEKAGLLSLLDESTPIENAPPKMVPIDAISFSRLNIAFKDMIPMVRDIAASMPMGGQEIENGLDMYEPTIKPALDTLGPQVYFYGTVRKPIEMDSASSVMMVEAKDSDRVHPLLAMMGPSMGMEPRDFKGETIWSDDMGMMSLAVAGKWMLMGESRGVEQAIRAMGGGAETIGDNPIFASSIRRFDEDEVVGWGWTDIVEQYAVQRETLMNIDEMMGGFDEFGMGDMDEGMGDTSISKMFEELTPEDLARCVGPMIWSVTSSKDGLVQRILFLHPTKQAGLIWCFGPEPASTMLFLRNDSTILSSRSPSRSQWLPWPASRTSTSSPLAAATISRASSIALMGSLAPCMTRSGAEIPAAATVVGCEPTPRMRRIAMVRGITRNVGKRRWSSRARMVLESAW